MAKELYTMSESDIRMMVRAKIAERLNEGGEFTPHGYKTMSNSGGAEVEISNSGDAARFRYYGGEPTDWMEIEFDEEGVGYVKTERGVERLCDYMRCR